MSSKYFIYFVDFLKYVIKLSGFTFFDHQMLDIDSMIKPIFDTLEHFGYLGIIGVMAIESTALPVIIPSEVFLITYGVLAFKGEMSLSLVILSASIGVLIGSFINYYMAAWLGRAFLYKYGKYVGFSKEKIIHWESLFLKYSKFIVFIGRFVPIPAVKHIVAIPAGLSRMNVKIFASLTTLGGGMFSSIVVGFGYWFGKKTEMLESFSAMVRTFIYGIVFVAVSFFVMYKIYQKFIKHQELKK